MVRVAVLVLLAIAPLIQEPRDRVPRPQPAGTGVIRGRVIVSDTGLPIRHGSVVLSMVPPTQFGPNGRVVTADGNVYDASLGRPRQTTTDADGAFGASPDSSVDPAEMALVPLTVADSDIDGLIVVLTRGETRIYIRADEQRTVDLKLVLLSEQ
jgi:hypothetical protein